MQGRPFSVGVHPDNLIWDRALPLLTRRLDPAIGGNILIYPDACCQIWVLSATPNGLHSRFDFGPPQPMLFGTSHPPSIPLPGNVPAKAPLRFYNVVHNAPVPSNYSAAPAPNTAPFSAGVSVLGGAPVANAPAIYGPPINPIVANMITEVNYMPFHRNRMLTGWSSPFSTFPPHTLFHAQPIHYY